MTKNCDNTYDSLNDFLYDMREHKLPNGFFLTEELFQKLIVSMQFNRELASDINKYSLVLALRASEGKEVDGLLALAESFANGR